MNNPYCTKPCSECKDASEFCGYEGVIEDTKEPITKNPTKDEVSSSRQESHRLRPEPIIPEVSSSESLEEILKDWGEEIADQYGGDGAECGLEQLAETMEKLSNLILLREQEAEKRTIAKLTKIWSEGDKTIKEALELITPIEDITNGK